jgi:hypothetical protein
MAARCASGDSWSSIAPTLVVGAQGTSYRVSATGRECSIGRHDISAEVTDSAAGRAVGGVFSEGAATTTRSKPQRNGSKSNYPASESSQ